MDKYEVEVECSNCDHVGTVSIKRGTPVPNPTECPNCGCKSAYKKQKKVTFPYMPHNPFYPYPTERWPAKEISWLNDEVKPSDIRCDNTPPFHGWENR